VEVINIWKASRNEARGASWEVRVIESNPHPDEFWKVVALPPRGRVGERVASSLPALA
jgi:hypothetical protein